MPTIKPRVMVVIEPEDVVRLNRATNSDPKYRGNRSEFIRDAVFRRVEEIERKKPAPKEAA